MQLKNCSSNSDMAAQVLYFTNAVIVLNIKVGTFIMFREDIDPNDLDIIKFYKDDIEALGKCSLYTIGLVSDEYGTYIMDKPIEDDDTLPLDVRIDNYFNKNVVKGRK